MIRSILFIQFTCLTVLFGQRLSRSSLVFLLVLDPLLHTSCAVNRPLRLRYERAQRGDERVCLCACLSVSPRAYLRNFMPDLHHIFVLVACDRDRRSVLLWRRCDTFSTSGFMNDVIFTHSGPSGCVSMLLQSDVTASSCAG